MDFSENNLCLKCNGGGNLLICSGCPLTFHEGCMNCPATFDEVGNFCCPHCSYKQAVFELSQTRKNVKSKRKALSVFMGIDGEEDKRQNNEAEARRLCQSEVGLASVSMGDGNDKKSRRKKNTQSVQINDEEEKENMSISTDRDSKRVQKSSSKLNQLLQLHKEDELRNADEVEKIQEPGTSSVSTCQDPKQDINKPDGPTQKKNCETYEVSTDKDPSNKVNGKQNISSTDEDHIQEEDGKRSLASNCRDPSPSVQISAKRRIEMNDFLDRDCMVLTNSASVRKKHVGQIDNKNNTSPAFNSANRLIRGSSSTRINKKSSDEDFEWRDPKHQSVKLLRGTPGSGRCRRVLWTEEEEEMLKVGVDNFSSHVKSNIPWKKILNFGHRVFDESRTPSDLKDKWRNIMQKT